MRDPAEEERIIKRGATEAQKHKEKLAVRFARAAVRVEKFESIGAVGGKGGRESREEEEAQSQF